MAPSCDSKASPLSCSPLLFLLSHLSPAVKLTTLNFCVCVVAIIMAHTRFGNYSVGRGVETLAMLQSGGVEVGSTVSTLPTNDQIIAWGRTVLGMA